MDSRFSLHCRPNGKVNACYKTLVGPYASQPSALRPTPIWGAIDSEYAHCHGNGNFLILRHPPGTCCPEVPGMFVEDATLDDLKNVISYLKQRHAFYESNRRCQKQTPHLFTLKLAVASRSSVQAVDYCNTDTGGPVTPYVVFICAIP